MCVCVSDMGRASGSGSINSDTHTHTHARACFSHTLVASSAHSGVDQGAVAYCVVASRRSQWPQWRANRCAVEDHTAGSWTCFGWVGDGVDFFGDLSWKSELGVIQRT